MHPNVLRTFSAIQENKASSSLWTTTSLPSKNLRVTNIWTVLLNSCTYAIWAPFTTWRHLFIPESSTASLAILRNLKI